MLALAHMPLLSPTPLPYDALEWERLPFTTRMRLACASWAVDGYGAPMAIYLAYVLKIGLYVGGWAAFCSLSPQLGGLSTIGSWWLEPVAFQKAILWSALFEVLGLGCGSGPLTGRYMPPVGGFLYFLRPGTVKLPLVPGLPLLGGDRRGPLDVLLYAGLVTALVVALVSATPPAEVMAAALVLLGLATVGDRTLFLAARGEHYATTILCFLLAGNWIAGAKAVQLALWFFAGVSKLNHHFPAVVGVMTSNSPVARLAWWRRKMYVQYPEDLRPSRLATIMAHVGTALEMAVPLVLLLAAGPLGLTVGIVLMLLLHGFITSNVPMGVPLEWNVMVVYGGFALFWAHPDVGLADLGSLPLALILAVALVGVPLLGNVFPHKISFLPAMRYYAGNWAFSVWLFRGESHRKMWDRLPMSSPWVIDQLLKFYDRRTAAGLVGKVMAFRAMHLHGRIIGKLLPRAIDRLEDYTYSDGEIVAGLVLGWNFGDGHLHQEQLLAAVQRACGFQEGELRCIFVESQPLGGRTMRWRIVDAARGEVERGEVTVAELRERQPWDWGDKDAVQGERAGARA
jgi:hypothetical protein